MVALARRSVDATGVKLSRDELGALAKELTAADDGEVDMLLLARTGLDDAGAKVLAQGIAKNRCGCMILCGVCIKCRGLRRARGCGVLRAPHEP